MMTTISVKTFIHSIAFIALLTACGGERMATTVPIKSDQLTQQNVDAVVWYNTSAENAYIYHQTYNLAKMMLIKNLENKTSDLPPAVVLDIDETVLDNSPYSISLIKNGATYTEESWKEWVNQAEAKLLPGVESFLLFCQDNGVEIFYVSNRSNDDFGPTLQNLINLNAPMADPDHVSLKTTTSDKTERRNDILARFDVILFIGDNLRDFDERFNERANNNFGKDVVENNVQEFLPRHLLLPNPMYGQWERIFSFNEDDGDAEKAAIKVEKLTRSSN